MFFTQHLQTHYMFIIKIEAFQVGRFVKETRKTFCFAASQQHFRRSSSLEERDSVAREHAEWDVVDLQHFS